MNGHWFNAAWYVILAIMVTAYAVLDGYDLGVGALHLFVARTDKERDMSIRAIGPVWNGNEVWLIAAGGLLFAVFPRLYAASFSGFYLALMLVLWLLILRGMAIEFRHQLSSPLWAQTWDVVFSASSAALALLFGLAVGNVLHGLPLNAQGQFQGSFGLLLNPFAILGGLLGVAVLALHGATYLAMKTEGAVHDRARRFSVPLWIGVNALALAMTGVSFIARPSFPRNFLSHPLLLVVPVLGGVAAAGFLRLHRKGEDKRAFQASCAMVATLLASAAAGLFPRLLPGPEGSSLGLDIYNAAAPASGLRLALIVYAIGIVLALAAIIYVQRIMGGKVRTDDRVSPH